MGRFRRFVRHNDLFITYMVPMVVVFILLFAYMLISANVQSRSLVSEDVRNLGVSRVEDVRYRVDMVLDDVNSSLNQLGGSADSMLLMKYEDPSQYDDSLTAVMKRLDEERNFTRGVENYGIFYAAASTVVYGDGTYSEDEFIRDVIGIGEEDLFRRQLETVDELAIWVLRDAQERVQYMIASQSYPQGRQTKLASGFAVISNSTLLGLLQAQINEYSNYLILDSDGEILLSANSNGIPAEMLKNMVQSGKTMQTMTNPGVFLYCIPSEKTGWYYAGVISLKGYQNLVLTEEYRNLFLMLGAFILALMISFLLSRRVTRQLHEMNLLLTDGHNTAEDESSFLMFRTMQRRLQEIVDKGETLSQTVSSNRDVLLEMFFRDIILQRAKMEDTTAQFTRLGIEWPKGTVFMALIRVRGDLNANQMQYRELCRQWLSRLQMERGDEVVFFPLQDDYLCCVVTVLWADRAPRVIGRLRYQLRGILHSTSHVSYELATSEAYPNLSYLPYAYQACIDELASQFYGVASRSGYMDAVDYPYEKERQLLNCLLSGDEQHMLERLEEFFTLNFTLRPLNLNAIDQFAHLLDGTLRRAITESELPEDVYGDRLERIYQRVDETAHVDGFCELFRNEFLWLCRGIADSRNNRSDVMAQRIRDFIAEHYHEELSMGDLAQELNLSLSYMSVVFKRCMGRNFSDYLNRYRVAAAKELLIHSDKTVAQIATETGFISANTFIRTFKKVEGITPGQFRGTGLNEVPEGPI